MSPAKHAFPQVNPHNRAPKQSLSCGTQACRKLGVTQSMGAVGSSADNALAESFNATMKREVLQDAACWSNELVCRRQVFRWLVRYNTKRRHSWCRYVPPVLYETGNTATLPTAA